VRQVHALWEAAAVDLSARSGAKRRPLRWRRRRAREGTDLAERLLDLRSWAARHLVAVADLGQGIAQAPSVLADYERVLGADHPNTLNSRNNLAYAYASAGRLGEAIPLYEQTLADREQVLGTHHPDTRCARVPGIVSGGGAGPAEAVPGVVLAAEVQVSAEPGEHLGEQRPEGAAVRGHRRPETRSCSSTWHCGRPPPSTDDRGSAKSSTRHRPSGRSRIDFGPPANSRSIILAVGIDEKISDNDDRQLRRLPARVVRVRR
jgi:hypothetical protein